MGLFLHQRHDLVFETVAIVFRAPLGAHVFDQPLGHVQLALDQLRIGDFAAQFERIQAANFSRPAQHHQDHGRLQRHQCGQVLASVQDHVGEGDLVGFAEGFAQQRVDLAAAFIGCKVVGCVDVLQGNLFTVDKGKDVDGLRGQRVRRLDLLLTEHHVAPLFVLHTFNDVLFGHLLAGDLVDALIADRLHAPAVEPVEIHPLGRRRRDQRHRNMHQPETDRAFPDCPCHGRVLASDDQVTLGLGQKFPRVAARSRREVNFVLHLAGEVLVNKTEPWA
ncbi:hypothetical protein D3C85_659000 [compost metagenome]